MSEINYDSMSEVDGIMIPDEIIKERRPVVFDYDSNVSRLLIIKKDGKEIYYSYMNSRYLFDLLTQE